MSSPLKRRRLHVTEESELDLSTQALEAAAKRVATSVRPANVQEQESLDLETQQESVQVSSQEFETPGKSEPSSPSSGKEESQYPEESSSDEDPLWTKYADPYKGMYTVKIGTWWLPHITSDL